MNFKQGIVLTVLLLFVTIYFGYPTILAASQGTSTAMEPHLSAYDSKYNDVSEFRKALESMEIEVPTEKGRVSTEGRGAVTEKYDVKSLISSPSVLLNMVDAENTVYIVNGVERKYDSSEVEALVRFVINGGKLIVCDDKGYVNDLADYFDITYYQGKLLDERYDEQLKNKNFTYTFVRLGTDYFTGPWTLGKSGSDGVFDQDFDGDGKIDEDPVDRTDNDNDNQILSQNGMDDDWDGQVDEPREGFDEDPMDDDLDGAKDEEIYDGRDNDGDGLIDEDTKPFKVVMHNATGMKASFEGIRSIKKSLLGIECNLTRNTLGEGSNASFVDMDGDGFITLPQPGKDINRVADAKGPIKTIIDVVVKRTDIEDAPMGEVVFIADADVFTNDLVTMPELNEEGKPILENGTPKLRYDNLAFGKALVAHLLPKGGIVVFDESMHSQDPMLAPLAGTLWTLAVITTNPMCSATFMIGVVLIGLIAYLVTQGRQSWIHIFNVDEPELRETWPTTPDLKRIRLRHLVLEKVRIKAGMSPEEFATLSKEEINRLIRDPQLVELVNNDNRTYTDNEILQLSAKLKGIKGRE